MKKYLEKYTINQKSPLISAMKKINKNAKGFLIVLEENKVCGVITDGDIRRDLIKNKNLEKSIESIFSRKFSFLKSDDDFTKVVEYFKENNIKFLPIIDDDFELVNIITKTNLHVLLLQNIDYNSNFDFNSIDDAILEHEIYPRPWGFYKTVILNDYCQVKIISVNSNSALSLQKHLMREEHWIILTGHGRAIIGDNDFKLEKGMHLHIPIDTIHRLINTSKNQKLLIAEVQLGDYFGEDDIVRFEDDYNRI